MAGTCSLVASRTARAAASPAPLSLRPAEPVTSELRQIVEPNARVGMLGIAASWAGVDFSASRLFPAKLCGLVLPGNRGGAIGSDPFSVIASSAHWSPFGLADQRSDDGWRIFS